MTFLQLTYFKAVCDLGTINKAANHLHISSPAISVSIHNLELEYGLNLFLRSGHKMILTEGGRLFYNEVSNVLQGFERLSAVAKDISQSSHVIRYGTVPLAGSYLTPLILHNFFNLYPNERLISHENPISKLLSMLLTGELDIALLPQSNYSSFDNINDENLEHIVVKTQGFYFATYAMHPLASYKAISVKSIVHEPLVLLSGSYTQNKLIASMYNSVGATPNVIYRTGQLKSIERFVTHGIASTFMYQGLIEETKDLVGIPVNEFPERINLVLIWRKSDYMYCSVKNFINSVKQLIPHL